MLDIGVIKSAVDLFGSLLDLINRSAKERRDAFERTIKPLYTDLQRIANEYYQIIERARVALEGTDPDLSAILRDVKSERASIIMARNEIMGQIKPFISIWARDQHPPYSQPKEHEYEGLLRSFAISIAGYFSGQEGSTVIADLIELLEDNVKHGLGISLEALRARADDDLYQLECRWTTVAERYASLKLFCDT